MGKKNFLFLRVVLLVVFFVVICFSIQSLASKHSLKTKSPSTVLKVIVNGNNKFVHGHSRGYFLPYQNSQHPILTMITCSDARVQTNIFTFDPIDKIFVIRNIGNQIRTSEGSIDYGVLHLHTPILLILGHTHCGAIKAAMLNYSNETTGIVEELDKLHLPLSLAHAQGSFEQRWLKNVQVNVDYQVEFCVKRYAKLIKAGELVVVGAVYDFINAYKRGYGRVIITNINGIKDIDKIKKCKALKKVSKKLRNIVVDRI